MSAEVGLTFAQDPQFKTSFMDVYTASTLQVQIPPASQGMHHMNVNDSSLRKPYLTQRTEAADRL